MNGRVFMTFPRDRSPPSPVLIEQHGEQEGADPCYVSQRTKELFTAIDEEAAIFELHGT